MASILGGMFNVSGLDKHERLKFFLLTLAFAFVIGSYTIAKELKDSIFVSTVGKDWLPTAKLLVIFLLIPAALIYSRIVDLFRRYQVLAFYSLLYGLILAIFTLWPVMCTPSRSACLKIWRFKNLRMCSWDRICCRSKLVDVMELE